MDGPGETIHQTRVGRAIERLPRRDSGSWCVGAMISTPIGAVNLPSSGWWDGAALRWSLARTLAADTGQVLMHEYSEIWLPPARTRMLGEVQCGV